MRKIAENEVHTIFGDSLSPDVENELATALVRQWMTYDGYAGLLADQARFWWQIKKTIRATTSTVAKIRAASWIRSSGKEALIRAWFLRSCTG